MLIQRRGQYALKLHTYCNKIINYNVVNLKLDVWYSVTAKLQTTFFEKLPLFYVMHPSLDRVTQLAFFTHRRLDLVTHVSCLYYIIHSRLNMVARVICIYAVLAISIWYAR